MSARRTYTPPDYTPPNGPERASGTPIPPDCEEKKGERCDELGPEPSGLVGDADPDSHSPQMH